MTTRGQIEALLDLLGRPWPWDAAISLLIDGVVIDEDAAA
jgi:hypothetical protein